MSREIQQRGIQQSGYERPNDEWICGWTRDGTPCPLGPDRKGNCVVTHECTPYRKGDRWLCARASAFGGACENGPRPDGTCCHAVSKCQRPPRYMPNVPRCGGTLAV